MPRLLTIDPNLVQDPAIIALCNADLEPPPGEEHEYLLRYLFLVTLAIDGNGSLVHKDRDLPISARDVSLMWSRGYQEAEWWEGFFRLLQSLGLLAWVEGGVDPELGGNWCIPQWDRTWGRPRSEWPDARRTRARRRRGGQSDVTDPGR